MSSGAEAPSQCLADASGSCSGAVESPEEMIRDMKKTLKELRNMRKSLSSQPVTDLETAMMRAELRRNIDSQVEPLQLMLGRLVATQLLMQENEQQIQRGQQQLEAIQANRNDNDAI